MKTAVLASALVAVGVCILADDRVVNQSAPKVDRDAPASRPDEGGARPKFTTNEGVHRFRQAYATLLQASAELDTSDEYVELIQSAARESDAVKGSPFGRGSVRTFAGIVGANDGFLETVCRMLSHSDAGVRAEARAVLPYLPVYGSVRLGGQPYYAAILKYFQRSDWHEIDDAFPEELSWYMFFRDRDLALATFMMAIPDSGREGTRSPTIAQLVESIRHEHALLTARRLFGDADHIDADEAKKQFLATTKAQLGTLAADERWYVRAWAADFSARNLRFAAPSVAAELQKDPHVLVRGLAGAEVSDQ